MARPPRSTTLDSGQVADVGVEAPEPDDWKDIPVNFSDPNDPNDLEPRQSLQRARDQTVEHFKKEMESLGQKLFPEHTAQAGSMAMVFTRAKDFFRRFARQRSLTPSLREQVLIALLEDHREEFGSRERSVAEQLPWLANQEPSLPKVSIDRPPPPKLPKVPPDSWASRDLNKRENPMQFLRRVYNPWISVGFEMRMLRPIDPDLYRACSVWTHRHPEDRIEEVTSPRERMANIIDQLCEHLTDEELRRLGYAIDARFRKK